MATRPAGVPADATPIAPGQTFGPGIGVQQATIKSIAAQDAKANAQADANYARALMDWCANATIDQQLGLRIPPMPQQPQHIVLNIVYATPGGEAVPTPEGADGTHWAWIWEVYE